LRYRQSSLIGNSAAIAERAFAPGLPAACMQRGPKCVASRTPFQEATDCGSRQRKAPTGGAA
jgi:hypothetical protein